MSEIWIIRSTFAKKEEALLVARTLLGERLIACANIDESVTALFPWEGSIHEEPEVAMLAKTTKENVRSAIARIKALHSYQVPSVVAWAAGASEPSYAAWVAAETH